MFSEVQVCNPTMNICRIIGSEYQFMGASVMGLDCLWECAYENDARLIKLDCVYL